MNAQSITNDKEKQMLLTIRDINTGDVIKSQQISDDAGNYQCVALAQKILTTMAQSNDDVYGVAERDGIAVFKFDILCGF